MFEQKNGGDHSDDEDELSASDESEPEEQPNRATFVPELDDDEEEEEEEEEAEVCAPAGGDGALSVFSLRGGNSAFTNRSHSIFDGLDSVVRSASSSVKQGDVTDGVFVRPLPPCPSRKTSQPPPSCPIPAKKKGPPDYLVHPERWTHYSLEDVTETSDQGNSRAAHHFLSSLRQRKEQEEKLSDSSCDSQQKIIFSKPRGHQKEQVTEHLSPVRDKEKETHLSHLEEEEDDEQSVEKRKAGGRRKDQSEEKRNEEKERQGAAGQPEESKQEQKEKSEEEEKIEEVNPNFTSFRKSKLKNYRKSSGREEN